MLKATVPQSASTFTRPATGRVLTLWMTLAAALLLAGGEAFAASVTLQVAFDPASQYRDLSKRVITDPVGVISYCNQLSEYRPSDYEIFVLRAQAQARLGDAPAFLREAGLAQFFSPADRRDRVADLVRGVGAALYADHGAALLRRGQDAYRGARFAEAASLYGAILQFQPQEASLAELAIDAAIRSGDALPMIQCVAALRRTSEPASMRFLDSVVREHGSKVQRAESELLRRVSSAYRDRDIEGMLYWLILLTEAGSREGAVALALSASNMGATVEAARAIAVAVQLGAVFAPPDDTVTQSLEHLGHKVGDNSAADPLQAFYDSPTTRRELSRYYGQQVVEEAARKRRGASGIPFRFLQYRYAGLWTRLNPDGNLEGLAHDLSIPEHAPHVLWIRKSQVVTLPLLVVIEDESSYARTRIVYHQGQGFERPQDNLYVTNARRDAKGGSWRDEVKSFPIGPVIENKFASNLAWYAAVRGEAAVKVVQTMNREAFARYFPVSRGVGFYESATAFRPNYNTLVLRQPGRQGKSERTTWVLFPARDFFSIAGLL